MLSEPALPILYRDGHLVAFLKPSGMLVHRGWARDRLTAVDLAAAALGARVYPVHRLDRGTSGVLLFALSSEVAAATQLLFRRALVAKTYLALVRDTAPPSGVIDHPVPNEEHGPRVDATTDFTRLWVGDHASLLEARPHTGRLHQVRRHMKHIRHPVVGDANYGDGKVNRYHRDRYGLARLALHAWHISLPHPIHGVPLAVHAQLPPDLALPFTSLGIPPELWATAPRESRP